MINKRIKLCLFFTYKVSLKRWAKTGLLQREILLYKKLIENGIDVTFVTYGDETDYEYQELLGEIRIVPFYEFVKRPSSRLIQFIQSFFLIGKIKEQLSGEDIFKTNQIWGGWNAVSAKKIFGKPLIARCGYEPYSFALLKKASFFMKWANYFVAKSVYQVADIILMPTEEDSRFIVSKFKIDKSKIEVRGNIVDTELFKNLLSREYKDRLLFIGRLTKQKNLSLLINALSGTGIALDIIGDGVMKQALLKEAEEKSVELEFSDHIPNDQLPSLYNQYPLYVLCSHYEGNPKTLLEAMACERAVIGMDAPGISSILQNNKNGILIDGDPDKLKDAIQSLIKDEDLRKSLGCNARKTIINSYSLEQGVSREIATVNLISEKR